MNNNELVPSVLILEKGLDLSSPKLTAEPGSLLDCLNYEITDTVGLSRIYGYEPYDGQVSPSNTSFYEIVFDPNAEEVGLVYGDIITVGQAAVVTVEVTVYNLADEEGNFIIDEFGNYIVFESNSESSSPSVGSGLTRQIAVAKVVEELDNNTVIVAAINVDLLNAASTMSELDLTDGSTTELPDVVSVEALADQYTDVADEPEYYAKLLQYAALLRADITPLGYPASGLHFFRDALYAVAPTRRFAVNAVDGDGTVIAGNWTHTLDAESWIANTGDALPAYVLSAASTTDDDSIETLYINVVEQDPAQWDIDIEAGETLTGTGFSAGGATGATGLKITAVDIDINSLNGTLWKCKDVQKWMDDGVYPIDFGWHPINQGFTVGFDNGDYVSDTPPKMERSFQTIPTTATYYLTDGTNVISCEMVSYFVSAGTFTGGNATGVFQLRNLEVVDGSMETPDNTWDIHTAYPIDPGNKMADLSDSFLFNSLPTNPALVQDNVRYEFVTANFFSEDTWDAFYGVNGFGRAFYYADEQDLFAKIYTQIDSDLDKPRHVAFHKLSLALAFRGGSLQMSVVGEPFNYSGDDGATEIGMGDRITGLQSLNGDTLGVFCEQSIRSVRGASVDEYLTEVISPNTGCIEYTLANMGTPIYCNSYGIVSLEQSDKYGDYVGTPLSFPVNNFIRPRLNRVTGRYSSKPGVIVGFPVRAKNQYRLVFKDGLILTMTAPGDGSPPKFTKQQYNKVPWAVSSQTDGNGEEWLHFSDYDARTGLFSTEVFELDKGWGFAGTAIEHFFEANWFSGQTPVNFFTVKKVRLHGISRGRASLKISASGTQNQYASEYHTTEQYIDLPRSPILFSEEGEPISNNTDLANRGLSIQLKVENRTLTTPEPSHICQVLVLQSETGGRTDG